MFAEAVQRIAFPFFGKWHLLSRHVSCENDIYCRDQVTISYHPGERIPSVLLFFGLNKCVDAPWPSAALLENGSSTNPLTGTSPSRSKGFMAGLIKGNQWVFYKPWINNLLGCFSPTHRKNMSQIGFIFPKVSGWKFQNPWSFELPPSID